MHFPMTAGIPLESFQGFSEHERAGGSQVSQY
jgi:hypothetical protein